MQATRGERSLRMTSPSMAHRLSAEVIGTFWLVFGLSLTLLHLISIPISNTAVNPARSTGVAFFNDAGAPGQLWLFWLAPLAGAALAGVLYPLLFPRYEELAARTVRDARLDDWFVEG